MQRKSKDGLISGVRILIMEKRVLKVILFQATYILMVINCTSPTMGKTLLASIVENVGHKQIDCNKRAKDFSIFIQNQDSSVRNLNSSSRQYDGSSAVKRQKLPCNN